MGLIVRFNGGERMVYKEFTKAEWLDALGMVEDEVPQSFIIHGEWEHYENLEWWKERLQDSVFPKWNTVIGKYRGKRIGFANVYGSPMAVNISHPFAAAGTDVFIQTGYFGGISNDVQYGDILIVAEAEIHDGVSQHYLPGYVRVRSDDQLVRKAVHYCEEKGYSYVIGSVISISSFHVETEEMIKNWASRRHVGVDMETASTLTVAKKFRKKAISLLNLTDHLLRGDHLYHYTKKREQLEAKTDERIWELALHLADGNIMDE